MKERGIVKSYANLGLYRKEFMSGNCWYASSDDQSACIKRRCLRDQLLTQLH